MSNSQDAEGVERHARREAGVVLAVWGVALIWSVGYCYLKGYQHEPDALVVRWGLATPRTAADFTHILGIPDWVCVGIILPWIVCTLFTFVFALFGMTDDDLGREAGDGHGP